MRRIDSRYLWSIAIFAIALLLRLVYLFQIRSNFPGWDTPTIDPLYHDLWAKQIASGDIFGTGPFFRAPFYAYFLGLIYAIFGPSLLVAKIIQHIIGAASCTLIFLFADRYFGRRTAILASIISAFYWVFIYFENELLLDSLLVFFSILLIWLLMRASEVPTLRRFFASGLMLGLVAITRPNFLVFWPAILIWMLYCFGRKYRLVFSRFAVLSLGCVILILPVTVRNIIVGHDLVLIASQGGINFYIGNNEHATGTAAVMPEFGASWQYADCEYLARYESGRLEKEMKPSEVSTFYYKRAFKHITEDPMRWSRLMARKLGVFWNSYEISNNQNLYFFRRFAPITAILPPLFFIISPFSLVGLWLLFRRERKYHIIGYFIVVYMLTVAAFFVNSRFRLPVLPFLIILSVSAFFQVAKWIHLRDLKKSIPALTILLLMFIPTNIDLFGVAHVNFAMSHFSMGNIYLKKGLLQSALDEYGKALELADCVPSAHVNRGIIFLGMRDLENARQEFEFELEKCVRSAHAHNNLSVLDRLEGNPRSALTHARMAIVQSPQHLEAYVNVILALRMLGDDDGAFGVADSLTIIFPDYLPGHYFKGKISSDRGDWDLAEHEFRLIISKGPENIIDRYDLSTIYTSQTEYGYKAERMPGLAYHELGLLEVKRGEIGSALTFFLSATEILPDYPDAWTNLALSYDHLKMYENAVAAFRKSLELDPDNAVTYYNFGLTLGKLGLIEEAEKALKIALTIKPDFPEAKEKLEITESLLESSFDK